MQTRPMHRRKFVTAKAAYRALQKVSTTHQTLQKWPCCTREGSSRQRLFCDTMAHVNSSRLKEGPVFQIPGLQANKQRHDVYLACSADVGFVLHNAHEEDCDKDAMHHAKMAEIVRKDLLTYKYSFLGSF